MIEIQKPRLSTLIILAAAAVISLNLFLPAMPEIADDFQVGVSTITWALSGYLVVTGVLQLIIGPLSDRVGRRPVMLTCLSIFIVASFAAALAPNVTLFFIARFIQGVIVGAMVLTQAVVRDISTDRAEAAKLLASISMVMALGPMFGPLIGGTLADLFGWRSNFYFLAVFGCALLLLALSDLKETNRSKARPWKRQFSDYLSLLTNLKYWGFALCNAFSIGMFYAFLAGIPIVGREQLGLSNTMIGIILAALPVGYMSGNAFVRSRSKDLGLPKLIVWGRLWALAGPLVSALVLMTDLPLFVALFPLVLVGVSNGLTAPTTNAGAISINPEIAGSAAGLTASMTLFWGCLITLVTASLLEAKPELSVLLLVLFVIALAGVIPTWLVWRDDKQG